MCTLPAQTAGWLLGAVSSYSTGGPSLHYNGVREAEQFQPSCRGRNQTKSGCSDAVWKNKKKRASQRFSGPLCRVAFFCWESQLQKLQCSISPLPWNPNFSPRWIWQIMPHTQSPQQWNNVASLHASLVIFLMRPPLSCCAASFGSCVLVWFLGSLFY